MVAIVPFTVLLLFLAGTIWLLRGLLLALLVRWAEQGHIVPLSLTLARVGVPGGESFVLGLPARPPGGGLRGFGTLVLTTGRVRFVRRRAIVAELPLTQVKHLTVQRGALRLDRHDGAPSLELRVPQPALIARYVQLLAARRR